MKLEFGNEDHIRMIKNNLPPISVHDEFEDDFDEDSEDEICGYYCLCCGNIQDDDGECMRCMAYALDPIYF